MTLIHSFFRFSRLNLIIFQLLSATLFIQPLIVNSDESSQDNGHFNRLLKTQLINTWALADHGMIVRAVEKSLQSNQASLTTLQSGQTYCHAHLYKAFYDALVNLSRKNDSNINPANTHFLHIGSHIIQDMTGNTLPEALNNITSSLRAHGPVAKPSSASQLTLTKAFLIPRDIYEELITYLAEITPSRTVTKDSAHLDGVIEQLKLTSGVQDIQELLYAREGDIPHGQIALLKSPFTKEDLQKASESSGSNKPVVYNGVHLHLATISWKRELIRQSLFGALNGASVELLTTAGYKVLIDGRPPWQWEREDQTDMVKAVLYGALRGAATTAGTWGISHFANLPVWISNPIVMGSSHLLEETARIALGYSDTTAEQLFWSIPESFIMSTAAYAGEQLSPIPFAGALTGSVIAHMALSYSSSLAHNGKGSTQPGPSHNKRHRLPSDIKKHRPLI